MEPSEVLQSIDAPYLADYLCFGGQLREYIQDVLSAAFRADPNEVRRRHHVVALVQLEYASYEDAAAILKAWIAARESAAPVLEVLAGYRPGDAILDDVFRSRAITSAQDLYSVLRIDDAISRDWATWFPEIDLKRSVLRACQFLVLDCRANQKRYGIAAYNKAKHGPLVVESGEVFGAFSDVPSMLIPNKENGQWHENPFIVYGFPVDDVALSDRGRVIHFVQRSLRMITAVLFASVYPSEVKRRWGTELRMWQSRCLRDVLEMASEISAEA